MPLSTVLRAHKRVVHGSDCWIQCKPHPFPLFSQSTLCTCSPQLETLIYLHTLDLLLQLKPGRINTLKMHLVEPAPREMPVAALSTSGRKVSQERSHLPNSVLMSCSTSFRQECLTLVTHPKQSKQTPQKAFDSTHFLHLGSVQKIWFHIFILS